MKQATILLVLFGVFMPGSPGTWADSGNPFGFGTNTHPSEYEYCQKETGLFRNHGYKCSSAPRPHPDILEYELGFVEQVGLCCISAKTDSDLWYYRAGQPEGDSYAPIDIQGVIDRSRLKKEFLRSSWERHIRTQIRNFLEELGPEQDHENLYPLARLLEAHIWRSPGYGKRFYSKDTKLLRDAFNEMKKQWFVAGQSTPLIEWNKSLEKVIEKEIRADWRNKFETFNRQITKKYGPPSIPEGGGYNNHGAFPSGIISATNNAIIGGYKKGYNWSPKEGVGGLGDIEQIRLRLFLDDSKKPLETQVQIFFWLVTFNDCHEKIDKKGDQAF